MSDAFDIAWKLAKGIWDKDSNWDKEHIEHAKKLGRDSPNKLLEDCPCSDCRGFYDALPGPPGEKIWLGHEDDYDPVSGKGGAVGFGHDARFKGKDLTPMEYRYLVESKQNPKMDDDILPLPSYRFPEEWQELNKEYL